METDLDNFATLITGAGIDPARIEINPSGDGTDLYTIKPEEGEIDGFEGAAEFDGVDLVGHVM